MNKNEKEQLKKALERIVSNLESNVDITGRIVEIIYFLKTTIQILFFITGWLFWKVFLLEPTRNLFSFLGERWVSLAPNYQTLILNFFGVIIAGIIAQVIGGLLLDKITSSLQHK